MNCGTAQDFIECIRATLTHEQSGLHVYVATKTIILHHKSVLFESKCRIQSILDALPSHASLTSVEVFAIELQLMASASKFVGWGITGIHSFVERIRRT